MNTLNPKELPGSETTEGSTAEITPIRVYIVFRNPEQADLFEKLLKRITKHDLKAMLFPDPVIDVLLTALGCVRVPLKQLRVGAINTLEKR